MKKALVIQHVASEGLGNLEPVLIKSGYEINFIRLWLDDFSKFDPIKPDLMVVLGGPIGVYNRDKFPLLDKEINFIKMRTKFKNLPTLGICLGSQIIAHTLGANIYPGQNGFELGYHQLTNLDGSSLFSNLNQNELKVLHWHGDTFDLPPGTKRYASSKQYINQAYATENFKIMGLQFHLEVAPTEFEGWLISNAPELLSDPQINIAELRSDNLKYGIPLQEFAIKFWTTWINQINKG